MKEIVCSSGVDLLMDYLEGVLPAELSAAVDAHVAKCPRCVAFVASYRATPRIVRDATAAALPADQQRSLRSFLHTLPSPPPSEG
jgi:anti-sigma factor RsiW